ncbi:MAG TPA: adenosylcobinamide-GDP ribazoletransferase [Stellaceae bacterium]|nr:adenosylcobinamide-GDP ribazoletransferase [Stellaceae bacterium]
MQVPYWNETGRRRDEFLLALRFLTRLPLGAAGPPEPGALAPAGWAFPIVGAFIGIVSGLAYAVAASLDLPPLAAGLIAIGASVLLTGGLHEDGLADTADGLGGGSDPAERLAIMRDSRLGSFGVLALIFSVGLRAAAIAFIATRWQVLGALIAAHAVGRGALPAALALLPPARSEGLGAEAGQPDQAVVLWSAGIAVVIALAALGWRTGIEAAAAAAIVMALRAWIARRQLGGQTGDVLGAIEQGGETVVLLAAAAWGP